MGHYLTSSAVLFIIFNRPDTTSRVFEQIRKARPAKLYIAADGPRDNKPGEAALCATTRQIIEQVDWDCQVQTLLRETNFGCKNAVSSAITWFFEQEEEGIILEDDCLPDNSFFSFCDVMLAHYRNDTRIRHITGSNLQHGKKWGNGSYYFSNLTQIWGWASWRRVWKDYDKELSAYSAADVETQLSKIFTDPFVIKSWRVIFDQLKAGMIDTWDYQLVFINFFNDGLSVVPNKNLISNIGFGEGATHTAQSNKYDSLPLEQMDSVIIHPQYMLPEKEADDYIMQYVFNVDRQRKKHNSLKQRIKRLVKPKKN
jgi:hypothetical protein